ncbi:MAG: hypothetical protein ACE5JX_12465 [Acidobacteriota bacterium]
MVATLFLSLIGLALTVSSLAEFSMSNEFEAHEKAIVAAEAGFNLEKYALRGQDLTTVLSASTEVPEYGTYPEPEPGTSTGRNPMDPNEARNTDFDSSSPVAMRTAYGWLTPPEGVVLGTKRYFASLSDNRDETPLGMPEDSQTDIDSNVYMRVIGLHPEPDAEGIARGAGRRNSVAIVEGLLRRDRSFDLTSPLVVEGPDVDATFDGSAFDLVGDAEHAAVSVISDNPAEGDAQQAYASMLSALGSQGTVEGAPGPDGVSLVDATDSFRTSDNPDASNVFDANFLANLVDGLRPYADNLYPGDVSLDGGAVDLGTVDSPKLTLALGNLEVTGASAGAGLLVVKGALDLGGAFVFDGVVLAIGQGDVWLHGANKDLTGGLFVARLEDAGDGSYTFGVPTTRFSGNSNLIFDSDDIQMGLSLLPLRTLSLREVTPELDPVPGT